MSKQSSASLTRDDESRRIIREELGTNLLVEAGAGSGKTQMLAERMAAGIASGAYEIEYLVAVTFTRKAASELRGRFHLALENELQKALVAQAFSPATGEPVAQASTPVSPEHVAQASRPANSEREARIRAALGNLERFFAGTIHAFCARLLRERPVESGVSPGFTELDEVQDEELRNRSWRDFVASARAAGDKTMLELLEAGVRPKDLDDAFAIVSLNEDVEFPAGDGACPDPGPAWTALQKFWNRVEKELPASIDPDTRCSIQKAAREFRRKLRVAGKRVDRPRVIADLLHEWDCESRIVQYRWADSAAEKKRLKNLVEPLHAGFCADTVQPYLSQWRQYIYRLAVTLLTGARAHAARERRRLNSLNYGDLLNLTANVLRENAQVRRALQKKYRYLFVDEFQDTDPIQAEIVFLLAADEGGASVAQAFGPHLPDWRTVPVRPGSLFVVGDPKQSIYRFRRADIEIYNIVRGRFSDPHVGRVVPLTKNFRSIPALCTWANTVFEGQFPAEPTHHSPKFAPLEPHEDRGATASGGLFTLSHACGDYKDVPAHDAAAIARYIRSEVDAGRRRFNDFLILTRKKKDRLGPYASALEQLNVPIEVSGAGAFGDSVEVKALTALLRALADPQDALPLIAVLRGPLFGISDADLFAFKQGGGWFSIFYPPPSAVAQAFRPAHAAVAAALAALHRYHRWTRMLPAGAALDRILEHTGYLALASTTPGGVEAGDLVHAVDRVRQVCEEGGSLADAADALEADGDYSNEVESLPLEPGRTDVVRLMNLHKAKGLEADVVFLADPCGGFKPRVDVHIRREGHKALGWFRVEKKSEESFARKLLGEHADWDQHEQAELPFLQAEDTRLLYVAATRAREMLVISRQSPAARTPAWGVLNPFLATAKELPVPAAVSVAPPDPASCSPEVQSAARASRAAAHEAVNQASWSITSVTAEAKHITRMTPAPEPTESGDATRVVAQDTPSHRADAGMAWGTLVHGLLEHAMRHQGCSRDDLGRLAMWLTVEEPQLRGVIEEALATVQRVAAAEFWHAAAQSEHSVETPFITGRAKALTSGVIDLVFHARAGWQLIDYKTDHALEPGKYAQQLEAYRAALKTLGCPVADASVVNARTGSS